MKIKRLLSAALSLVILFTIGYFGYRFCAAPRVVLPPPANPPAFGVSYVYRFSGTSILGGMDINAEIENDMRNIKAAGFDGIKVNFYFQGDNLISQKIVEAAARNGLYPIGQFVGHDVKPRGRAFTEEELAEWETMVCDEARRNKDIVYFWEIWNEPAMTELSFRYGTPAEYMELLKRTQKIIRKENPLAKVIVTADHTDAEAKVFTDGFLALGGAEYLDYLSFHPYNAIDPNGRYDLTETIAQEEVLSEKYGKPLWITEIGHAASDSSEERQAEIALAVFQASHEKSIPVVWFYWSDRRVAAVDGKSGWGLVREDNSSKPAFESIKSFISEARR